MPFYWPDFWTAVKGWPDCAIVGYQKALSHYWFHLHCAGLRDDAEFLRRVCEREKDDWDTCMELVFDNNKFFKLDLRSGLWRQKRADEEWARCLAKIDRQKSVSMAGVNARRKLGQLPPPKKKLYT